MKRCRTAMLLASGALAASACRWNRAPVDEAEARRIALKRIAGVQGSFQYDAAQLPVPSVRRVADGFDFEVLDEAQNISIFVHASTRGEPEISVMPLDEDRRVHEEAMRRTSRGAERTTP